MTSASTANASVVSVAPQRQWRLQFSLATLIWMTITAGALLLFGMSYRETLALREEVRKLREEQGVITFPNPECGYARALPTLSTEGYNFFRWRLSLPKGRKFCVRYAESEIPQTGVAQESRRAHGCDGGEIIVGVSYILSEKDGEIGISVADDKGEASIGHGGWKWKSPSGGAIEDCAGKTAIEAFNPNNPFVLLRRRSGTERNKAGHWIAGPSPAVGLMVWVQPEPDQETPAGATKP